MDAGEASLVGIGTWQEIAGLDAVPGPGEMETFEGAAEVRSFTSSVKSVMGITSHRMEGSARHEDCRQRERF